MSRQPSLLSITKEDGTNVLLPQNNGQVQAVRNDAAFGSGTYYAYFDDGTREVIGGPAVIGGMIGGGGTLNFIPKFTPDGMTIANSSLFDNGNIGYGTVAPVGVAAFDIVSTTKGMLIPRMTTAQRNLIATGATTDGLLIFNTSTEKFNFWNQTLLAWESIDTATGGDVSGSGTTDFIPRWTDGPNSILGDSIIRDNGTVAAVNRAVIATTMFAVQGADAGVVNYTFQTYNSTPVQTFGVRNDGYFYGGVGTSMTFGLGSKFDNTLAGNIVFAINYGEFSTPSGINNTVVGNSAFHDATTGSDNVMVGRLAGSGVSTGSNNVMIGSLAGQQNGGNRVFIGWAAGNTNTNAGVAVGYGALGGTGSNNTIIGHNGFSGFGTTGSDNTSIGHNAMQRLNSGSRNTYAGHESGAYSMLASSDNSFFGDNSGTFNNDTGTNLGTLARSNNTFIGSFSGQSNTGNNGIALGYYTGRYETLDNKLFIDSIDRVTEQDGRNLSLLYGKTDAAVANQFLVLNGVLYMKDTVLGNYWSIRNTAGAFVFADTGSANAPA